MTRDPSQNNPEAALKEANERALRTYEALLEKLDTLSQQVGVARDLTTIFRALFSFVSTSIPADGLIVSRYEPQAQERICIYAGGLSYGVYEEDDVSELPSRPLNDSPQSRAITSRDVVITDDLRVVHASVPNITLGSDGDERPPLSSIAVPLTVLGETVGVFELQSTRAAAFSIEHLPALRMAANLVAIAMQNVDLLERERTARLIVETSEARFKTMVQNGSDIITLVDADGKIIYKSPSVTRILGYTPAEYLGKNALGWVHPEDREIVLAAFTAATGAVELVYRYEHKNGTWCWLEATATNMLHNPHVQAIVLNSRDITDRKIAENSLRQNEASLQKLFAEAPAFMATAQGPEHTFTLANPMYLQFTGKRNIIGKTVKAVFPELEGQGVLKILDRVYRTGETFSAKELCLQLDREGNGVTEARYVNLIYQATTDAQGQVSGIMVHGVDITEQVLARKAFEGSTQEVQTLNQELQQRLKRLHAMHAIDSAITSSTDVKVMFRHILEQIIRELAVDAANILLFKSDSFTLEYGASQGFRTQALKQTYLRLGEGLAGQVALKRQPIYLEGAQEITKRFSPTSSLGQEGFVSYLAVPLISKGQIQGVLELFQRTPLVVNDAWQDFLEATAAQTAIAIDNATLFEGLERSNLELMLAYDTTIEGWARALDLKDEETEGHSRRVTDLTLRLARAMGLEEQQLVHIRRGALLHDIGKMGVPDAILLKPGKLDPEEWEIMQQHPRYAYDFLKPITFLKPALDIPYCHHEKWDGSGYPLGLSGNDIPLAARIFAIVDVYDALSSDRPYRKAWEQDRVMDFIKSQAGSHFDPVVTEAFLGLLETFQPQTFYSGTWRSGTLREGEAR